MGRTEGKKVMSFLLQKDINEFIKSKKILRPSDIEEHFKLTKSTTRRYLIKLEEEGFITRPFGEVIYNEKRQNYIDKLTVNEIKNNSEAKREIAKTASIFAKDYVNVYVDSGSSCYHILEFLDPKVNLYTNSLLNAMRAVELGFENISIIGGRIKNKSLSTVNIDLKSLENLKFQISYLGVNGIDDEGKLTTTDVGQGIMKNFVAMHSDMIVVPAMREKFGYSGFYNFTPENRNILVVTDNQNKVTLPNINIVRIKTTQESQQE